MAPAVPPTAAAVSGELGSMNVGCHRAPESKTTLGGAQEFRSKEELRRSQVVRPLYPQQGTATFPTAWTL